MTYRVKPGPAPSNKAEVWGGAQPRDKDKKQFLPRMPKKGKGRQLTRPY